MSETAFLLYLQQRALARVGDRVVEAFRSHYEERARVLAARLIGA